MFAHREAPKRGDVLLARRWVEHAKAGRAAARRLRSSSHQTLAASSLVEKYPRVLPVLVLGSLQRVMKAQPGRARKVPVSAWAGGYHGCGSVRVGVQWVVGALRNAPQLPLLRPPVVKIRTEAANTCRCKTGGVTACCFEQIYKAASGHIRKKGRRERERQSCCKRRTREAAAHPQHSALWLDKRQSSHSCSSLQQHQLVGPASLRQRRRCWRGCSLSSSTTS